MTILKLAHMLILLHSLTSGASKNFLWVKTLHTGYLKGPPGSGIYIGNKIMVIQLTNPFY
eukprot:UN09074